MKKKSIQKLAIALGVAITMLAGCSGTGTPDSSVPESSEAEVPQGEWNEADKETLRYVFTEDFGGLAGVCLPAAAMTDEARWTLATTQFNAVTCENEMKPESFLGQTANIGEDGFPILNFAAADSMLDKIMEYNATVDKEEKKLKVRGHVLVWHSQTPEWFFHEDYDANKAYVDSDTMLARMDNYMMQVMSHYYGEGSKYDGLIYAWDVVNEAVSDSTGDTRTDNSSWFNVFKSDAYVTSAFVYANKYAPADVKLFYNDYNDTTATKCDGICKLLEKIKATEGARIDGMGMQGHYDMNSPSPAEFETAVKKYAAVVDEIQITELDMKSSTDYDGSDVNAEYQKQAYKYKNIYDVVCRLVNEENINISSIIFWGTDDGNSWLQSSNSVGGSADGSRPQCPLLFDADYQAKPAFWAFVDSSKLEPCINEIQASQTDEFSVAIETAYEGANGTKVRFYPVWTEEGVSVKVLVQDKTQDDNDAVTVYLDTEDSRKDGASVLQATVKRSEADERADGYEAQLTVAAEGLVYFQTVGFDVCVTDNDQLLSWNDTTNKQAESSKYYGKLLLKPFATINKGTVKIDGKAEEAWNGATAMPLTFVTAESAAPEATANAKVLWDEEALYVWFDVIDPNLDVTGSEVHTRDSVEVFMDENNGKTDAYEDDDKQFRVNCENEASFNGTKSVEENITSVVTKTDVGYSVEMALKWTDITPEAGVIFGLELQINDCKSGNRLGMVNWYDTTNTSWSSPASYGTALLVDAEKPAEE